MTQHEWEAEVLDAIAGTSWRLVSARISEESPSCRAYLDRASDDRLKTLRVSRDMLRTTEARRAELWRQLDEP